MNVIEQGTQAKLMYSRSFCFCCWSFNLLVSTKPFCKGKKHCCTLSWTPFLQNINSISLKAHWASAILPCEAAAVMKVAKPWTPSREEDFLDPRPGCSDLPGLHLTCPWVAAMLLSASQQRIFCPPNFNMRTGKTLSYSAISWRMHGEDRLPILFTPGHNSFCIIGWAALQISLVFGCAWKSDNNLKTSALGEISVIIVSCRDTRRCKKASELNAKGKYYIFPK